MIIAVMKSPIDAWFSRLEFEIVILVRSDFEIIKINKNNIFYGSPLTEDLAYPTIWGYQLSASFCLKSNPNTTTCWSVLQGPGRSDLNDAKE